MPPKPRKFTEAEIKEIETLSAVLNQEQVADYFGISQDTFQRICKRDKDVMRSYKLGKSKAIASVGGNLLQQARSGNISAITFYLKTQAGWSEKSALDINTTGELTIHIAKDEADL